MGSRHRTVPDRGYDRLAIRLSDYGVGDYWDDVDQYVRNHLTESQLLRADLLEKVSKGSVEYPDAWKNILADRKACKVSPILESATKAFPGHRHAAT